MNNVRFVKPQQMVNVNFNWEMVVDYKPGKGFALCGALQEDILRNHVEQTKEVNEDDYFTDLGQMPVYDFRGKPKTMQAKKVEYALVEYRDVSRICMADYRVLGMGCQNGFDKCTLILQRLGWK